ncbi:MULTISPECIES: enoyl-CoA hydratase/isomerase family protein [Microbacterium]|nr:MULTISPECIES: enoyl-CoA hydratase-related protein [Microbacterium]MCK6066138.1 enoyl-CoA hydratase/isomerase family protein [Microbacterium sp. EYE_512]
MSNEIRMETHGGVAVLTIDRPSVRNALNEAALDEIVRCAVRVEEDPAIKALILTGAGSQAFSSGRDLKERAARDAGAVSARPPMRDFRRNAFEAIWECRKPTIAAINGDAVGGGFEVALACDLRVSVSHARFALPEAKRGLGAVFGSTILARSVPSSVYFEWVYLGDFVAATELQRWGLLNRVVEHDALGAALEMANEIATRAPLSIARFKATLVRGRELPVAAALRADFHPDPYTSEDRVEGVAAFAEKRAPRWTGR